jgi:uncharacterized repeat protein (TIGR03803 family)
MQPKKSSHAPLLFAILLAALLGVGSAFAQTENVLYSFRGGRDGINPSTGLIADSAGNLFGTTTDGGSRNCQGGCGVVFELKPAPGGGWTESVIYSFQSGLDGAFPSASLIFDQTGNLYGTTLSAGKFHDGTVFQLTPSGATWTETVLHTFTGKDGAYPTANLIFDSAGNLYGTTLFGGPTHGGTVFQLSLSGSVWTETVLYSFNGRNDGIDPAAGMIFDPNTGQNGVLYGTTMGGNVFALTPPAAGHKRWTLKSIYTDSGGQDGGQLSPGTLLADKNGALYGTRQYGGPANAGAVFQLTPPAKKNGAWTATTLYRFGGGSDGLYPYAGVIADATGNLYGTTGGDGKASHGTVFQLTPPAQPGGSWTKTTLYAFTGGNDGSGPDAGLIFGKGGALYSTTAGGGASGKGTVFEIVP